MSKQILKRPESEVEGPPQAETRKNDIAGIPAERPLNTWLRRTSSDSAALAIIGGAVVAAFLLVALVIALVGSGLPARSNSSGAATNQNSAKITAKNVPAHQTFDPRAPVAPSGDVVNVKLVAKQQLISITSGVAYQAWTFNGTVPGPVIRVRQGQTVHFTLQNDDKTTAHSIDFSRGTDAAECELQARAAWPESNVRLARQLSWDFHVSLRHATSNGAHAQRHVRRNHRRSC
jgi:Multicopper oxidase